MVSEKYAGDPDLYRSASHRLMIEHLTAPLAAGAQEARIPIAADGLVQVGWTTREPLALLTLARSLEGEMLAVTAVISPGAVGEQRLHFEFASFSEEGASLPLFKPFADLRTHLAQPFDIQLSAERFGGSSPGPIAPNELEAHLEVHLTEGVLGRLIYTLGAEKQRLRRMAREIGAMRELRYARDEALDRLGAELGVVRFADEIGVAPAQDGALPQIVTTQYTQTRGEPDSEYRNRLAIYRRFQIPTRRNLLQMLNGEGGVGEPNAGLLAMLGVDVRFRVEEEDDEFAVAVHIVSANALGEATARDNFFSWLRNHHLVFPSDAAAQEQIHADRIAAPSQRAATTALRTALRENLKFAADETSLAPMLAALLERIGWALTGLGMGQQLSVVRAHDEHAGSRYELGLGADLDTTAIPDFFASLEPAVASLKQRFADGDQDALDQVASLDNQGNIGQMLLGLTPRPIEEDRQALWFFTAFGARTVHPLTADLFYLSHLPTFGLEISGPEVAKPGEPTPFTALFNATFDPGANVIIAEGLAAALAAWEAEGNESWKLLSQDDANALFANSVTIAHLESNADVAKILTMARLHLFRTQAEVDKAAARLTSLSVDSYAVLQLPGSVATPALAGDEDAVKPILQVVRLLQQVGIAAVLALATGDALYLVASTSSLPGVDINLSDHRSVAYGWYAVPVGQWPGSLGQIGYAGTSTAWTPAAEGVAAIINLGYARRGKTDPYEYRVDLPQDAMLTIKQYEFLMNVLQHTFPMGVEVNTWSIRQEHVDLDGDGIADPLPPSLFRTFRQFRRRERGEVAAAILAEGDSSVSG